MLKDLYRLLVNFFRERAALTAQIKALRADLRDAREQATANALHNGAVREVALKFAPKGTDIDAEIRTAGRQLNLMHALGGTKRRTVDYARR